MKILKIFGLVVGIHAIALLMIFANPGCSSTSKPPPAPTDTAPAADPTPPPAISVPGGAAPADGNSGIAPAPVPSGSDSAIVVPNLFSPTRPGTLAADALESQPVADVTPASTYVVGKGDSLWTIAKKNHLKVSALAKANHLSTGTALHLGQKLIIPGAATAPGAGEEAAGSGSTTALTAGAGPSTALGSTALRADAGTASGTKHVVRAGETLGAIARKYGVRMGDLATANNITDPQKIHPGQELVIPAKRGGAASSRGTRNYAGTAAAPAPAQPPAAESQDLDAGLPAASASIPTIKIDDTPAPAAEPKQQ